MSSAGRGPRLGGPQDNYATPTWCVDRLLDRWTPRVGIAVEPACGDGRIIEAVTDRITKGTIHWVAVDVRPEAIAQVVAKNLTPSAYVFDFLRADIDAAGNDVDTVITNPPYILAEQFIVQARRLYPKAEIVMLLRMGFLESESRVDFYKQIGAPDLYVLPNRPSFTNTGKTDSAAYSWFIWPPQPRQVGTVQILPLTSMAKRKASFV